MGGESDEWAFVSKHCNPDVKKMPILHRHLAREPGRPIVKSIQ